MSSQASASDYSSDTRPTNPVEPRRTSPVAPGRMDECLQLLARAIQQFHTYPPTSPLCLSAVDACHRAIAGAAQRDELDFRVMPHELIVDDSGTGRGTIVETELARRLHHAGVAQVTIERSASPRELTRFCLDLLDSTDARCRHQPLTERLVEHGVSRITLRAAYRPEVLPVETPPAPVAALVESQRAHREAMLAKGGPVHHLYAPDRGWVRFDPASPLPSVSLVDLALVVDDPGLLAMMLLRLTDGEAAASATREEALAQTFSDVTNLFAALHPSVGRVLFSRLSRAVLDLDPERRQTLLRRTILPGLLDGRVEGQVLRDFPDVDLADAICLLLDLETAAPEVVTTALARLELPDERQDAVMPLLRERMEDRDRTDAAKNLDVYARKLVNVDRQRVKSVAELSAFDLALDEQAHEGLARVRHGMAETDIAQTQLTCLYNLVRLEPNPDLVQRFVSTAVSLLEQLETGGQWGPLAAWIERYAILAADLADARPDVAGVMTQAVVSLATPNRARRLVDLAARDADGRVAADAVIVAFGASIGPALAAAATARGAEATREAASRAALQLLCDHAALVAPALVSLLPGADVATARTVARVLGQAGPGYEPVLATQVTGGDEITVREALRSLARMATPRAAVVVRQTIEQSSGWLATAASETLWHFPEKESRRQILDLLSQRDFVLRQPLVAERMLDRAAQSSAAGLEPVLANLASLRYRLWSPSLARVGRRAVALRQS